MTTTFDEKTKIWSGPEFEFQFDKHRNFGEYLLGQLADTDSERVMQVNIVFSFFHLNKMFHLVYKR